MNLSRLIIFHKCRILAHQWKVSIGNCFNFGEKSKIQKNKRTITKSIFLMVKSVFKNLQQVEIKMRTLRHAQKMYLRLIH